ncbi:amidohydrolase [Brevibacterium sanguinis]|uniref:Peptidase M20 domain-containing protein 2 n=2 Tax=Brevibacterium TaxID=1696 RepID=A0A366IN46_9MICO|nr:MULTISPECIES: M20 family metallopeptidase [Brevibacterium]RBP68085.1 amidohydrolase [Brevibacterium sanguinis]RBP74498.1 amidohydrolase [Brevibacterium celere]
MTVTSIVSELKEGFLADRIGQLSDVAADLHANPELRMMEHRASARLADELEEAGFAVERGYAGLDTAFVGRWSTPDADETAPNIAIYCEYDALPGIGHGCGHNIIAACGLGAALLVKDLLSDRPGTPARLTVVGSPGEEGSAGKVPMIEAGVLDEVDLAMMIHPGITNNSDIVTLACAEFEITFTGRASHAASEPEEGVNALDASTLSLNAIGLLRQQLPDDIRIHSIITDGGQAPNVIPESSSILCLVRGKDNEQLLDNVIPRVKRCFEGAALATGTTVEITQDIPAYLAMEPSPGLAELATEAFIACGREMNLTPIGAGSTDMGNVSQVVPSIHPIIALDEGLVPHTREFAAASGSAEAVPVIADGAVIMAATTLHVLQNPSLVADFAAEFECR